MPRFEKEIRLRHSVRDYSDTPLSKEQIDGLNSFIENVNAISGLNIELHLNEDIFSRWILGYGFIKHCQHHIRFLGKPAPDLAEKVGYFGELVILKAQELGLNTCWVGGTYRSIDKRKSQRATNSC